jgi:hypothetical protein
LARSGRQPAPGNAWEEPTQVVQASDVLGTLESAPSHPPPSEQPSVEQLEFERKLIELGTPVPAPPQRTRWLLWAVLAVLLGAGVAAFVEYSLHPMPAHSPSRSGAGRGR